MTANFEEKGLDDGFEIGIDLSLQQSQYLFSICREWEQSFPFVFKDSIELNGKQELHVLFIDSSRSSLNQKPKFRSLKILRTHENTLHIGMQSFDKAINFPPIDPLSMRDTIPLENRQVITVTPPSLPSNAKESSNQDKRYPLPVYYVGKKKKKTKNMKYYIVITNEKELDQAIRMKKSHPELQYASIVLPKQSV